MRATPDIPHWIRQFQTDGYTNVFELFPDNTKLYGTETLFGDWDAELLVLGKDAAPAHIIRVAGWRHAQRSLGDQGGWRTNERLELLCDLVPGPKLYGSAAANMLYNDPRWSRSLKGFWQGPLHEYLVAVLEWVIGSMPNARAIACLGKESWYLTAKAMGNTDAARKWQHFRDSGKPLIGTISGKPIIATPHLHPAARLSVGRMQQSWGWLGAVLESSV